MDETTAKIKAFIVEEFMLDVPVEDLEDDYDLLTGGVVDSLGLLKVVAWLEDEFDIGVDDSELGPDSFPGTVAAIKAYVDQARDGAHAEWKPPSEALAALVTHRYPISEEVWGDFWDRLAGKSLHPGEALRGAGVADHPDPGRCLRKHDARVAARTQSAARDAPIGPR